MAYTTYIYLLLFLGSTFLLYTVFPKKYKWIVLLSASYLYYILASRVWMIIFILLTTISIYIGAIWLDKINDIFVSVKKSLDRQQRKELKEKILWQKKCVVMFILFINLGLLIFLKYSNFLISLLNISILEQFQISIPLIKLFLPLGISFYTLQAISYIVDVYRGKYHADECLSRVALYLAFFPTIVEGPITRYNEVAYQLYEGHSFDYKNFTFGLQLILWGMFKKIVIADRANMLVNYVFDDYLKFSGLSVVIAIIFYTIQLYTEFSGCMDIVRGSAQLFSIRLPDNFRQPFFAKSINEFWQRWHITLGSWLRDYVFYSVSLSAPFKRWSQFVKKHVNEYASKLLPASTALFFVWICNGLWHGASIKYVMYGMYYYLLMMLGMYLEPVFMKIKNAFHIQNQNKFFQIFSIIRTILIVNIGMLIFRADTLSSAWHMLVSCFQGTMDIPYMGLALKDMMIVIMGVIIVYIMSLLKEKNISVREHIAKWHIVPRWTFYLTGLMIVVIFGAYGRGYDIVSFIYAQF